MSAEKMEAAMNVATEVAVMKMKAAVLTLTADLYDAAQKHGAGMSDDEKVAMLDAAGRRVQAAMEAFEW